MKKYKKLLINIFIFGIGGFGQKVLSFFLIPLYTSSLSTQEFGTVDLIINVVQLFFPVLNLSIHDAILSFALDKNNNPKTVYKIGAWYDVVSVAFFLCGVFLMKHIGIIQMDFSYLGFMCILYFLNIWNLYFSVVAKADNKIILLSIAGLCNTLVYLILNILFLKFLSWGIEGYMFAYVAGTFVSMIVLVIGLQGWQFLGREYNKALSVQMRRFSRPLIFNQAAWWINNVSDRYMVTWLSGVHMNGIYAVAYKIPNILSICQNFITQAWSISAIEEYGGEQSTAYYSKVFSIYTFLLSVVTSLLLLFNNALAKYLFRNEFVGAGQYVPILLLAVLYSGGAYFLGAILVAEKDSMRIMTSTIVGAVSNVVLNILLIPQISVYGAALATLVSNFIMMLIRLVVLCKKKCININIPKQTAMNFLMMLQIIVFKEFGGVQVCVLILLISINYDLIYEVYSKGKDFIWRIKERSR
ncbi:MAG: oligosaccharide flippase family protein [Anaeroplasmataceae bacterium]|nr:oligosaccharide flippase family protein [Anaeroplasmataceae bacterium]